MSYIKIQNLTYKYGNEIFRYNFEIQKSSMNYIIAPNGSGKTTLLNLIAGFAKPTSGNVIINNANITNTPINCRNIGILFTNNNLFPTLNAFDNVILGISKSIKHTKDNIKIANYAFNLLNINHLKNKNTNELSSGETKKVEIARILIMERDIFLLDEPLEHLDTESKIFIENLIYKTLVKQKQKTVIMTTHTSISKHIEHCNLIKF